MKSFKKYIKEARKSLVKGWTLKNKIVSVTSDYGNYHIMQVTNKPSKFGLDDKKLLKILEDWYSDSFTRNPKREAGIMLRKLKDGGEIDNSPTIEEYLHKKGYCSFVIDKTHGRVVGQTEKECLVAAKVLENEYLPYERSGFKLFEIKPVKGRPKYITSKHDWYAWLKGKKAPGKRTEIGSTMAQFRESKELPQIYCDMDQVLVDFLGGAKKVLGANFEDNSYWNKRGENKRELIDKQAKHFYAGLGWMSDGKKLWNFIKKYKPKILSSYPSEWAPNAKTDKMKWLGKNIKIGAGDINLVKRADKKKHATTNGQSNLLIDDFDKNIKEWKAAGGIGIHHKNTSSTIAQLKKIGY